MPRPKLAIVPAPPVKQPGNPNGNVNGKYNPSDFFYPPVDDKGHSQRLYCNVPPYVARELQVILHQDKFGFKDKEDILRWAVVDGLRKLLTMEPEGVSFLSQTESIMQTVKDEMYQGAYQSIFVGMEQTLELYRVHGNKQKARKYLVKMREKIESISDDFWRERAEKDFEDKFGPMLVPKLGIK